MSQFYIGESTSQSASSTPAYSYTHSNSSSDDEDTLPYPTELPRKDFLSPTFNPQTYLSSLRNRHQTLEDLRSDLRQRSQLLNKELLDLVNGNYEEFLSLGGDLKGGEEKVEGVRVGLLGFRREIEGIRKGVKERVGETKELLEERKELRRHVVVGRALLEVHEGIGELEGSLGITGKDSMDALSIDMDDEEVEDDEDPSNVAIRKLQRHAHQYLLLERMISRVGPSHPFIQAQENRMKELRKILLLDLAAALRQAREAKAPDLMLKILNINGDLEAEEEGLRVLRGG